MNIKKIEFRVSIDNKKCCDKCNNPIDGKRGFIFIIGQINVTDTWKSSTQQDGRANICLDCFDKLLRQKLEDEPQKEKIYKKLVKENEKKIKKNVLNRLR